MRCHYPRGLLFIYINSTIPKELFVVVESPKASFVSVQNGAGPLRRKMLWIRPIYIFTSYLQILPRPRAPFELRLQALHPRQMTRCRPLTRPGPPHHEFAFLSLCKPAQGEGEKTQFFEVLVRAQYFVVECGFKRFGLVHGTLWLATHISFE